MADRTIVDREEIEVARGAAKQEVTKADKPAFEPPALRTVDPTAFIYAIAN
jgi:hypothetical protein